MAIDVAHFDHNCFITLVSFSLSIVIQNPIQVGVCDSNHLQLGVKKKRNKSDYTAILNSDGKMENK